MTADSAPTWTRGPGRAGPCAPRNAARPSRGHGDQGGGLARGAHRPGTSHAAAGPGGSRTARTSQHGDPLTQPQGPAPETPRRTTSLRQPSRTRGSQPATPGDQAPGAEPTLRTRRSQAATPVVPGVAAADPTQPREPGPNVSSFPARRSGPTPRSCGGRAPMPGYCRRSGPTPRSHGSQAATPVVPRVAATDPTRPQGPGSSSWRTSGPPPGRRTPPSRPGSPGRSRGSSQWRRTRTPRREVRATPRAWPWTGRR